MRITAAFPTGVTALLFDEAERRRRFEDAAVASLRERGFSEVILPILDYFEPYESLLTKESRDELYRFEPDPAAKSEVLAIGRSLTSNAEFPVLWTRTHGAGRIVALTLGHDGAAHEHAAYRALLANAVRWVRESEPGSNGSPGK